MHSVHAVRDGAQFSAWKTELEQFVELTLRYGMNRTASAIEFVALSEAPWFHLPWRKLAVLTVENGVCAPTECSESAIDERAEIVSVNDMRAHAAKCLR
jgi:hypothetical protein